MTGYRHEDGLEIIRYVVEECQVQRSEYPEYIVVYPICLSVSDEFSRASGYHEIGEGVDIDRISIEKTEFRTFP